MSHLRNIVPFEPSGEMAVAVNEIQAKINSVVEAINKLAPENTYTRVARVMLEIAGHYANASFALYATGTPHEKTSPAGAPSPISTK